jgi:DNA-binding NarL/FixJ family response regulator
MRHRQRADGLIMHILLIEDDRACAALTERVLGETVPGSQVTMVHSGEEAEALLDDWECDSDRQGPDIVILDLGLPGLPGFAVLDRLRASRLTSRTPIMVFTASHDRVDRERAYAAGAMMYVVKPNDPQAFKERLSNIHRDILFYQVIRESLPLTPKEAEIVIRFCQGSSTEEVTEQLFISPATLRTHLRNIYQKTGVESRMELVSRVMQLVVHKLYDVQVQLARATRDNSASLV